MSRLVDMIFSPKLFPKTVRPRGSVDEAPKAARPVEKR